MFSENVLFSLASQQLLQKKKGYSQCSLINISSWMLGLLT